MAFKIVKQPTAWWPVEWPGVTEDGKVVTNKIEMQFELLKVDAVAAWIAEVLDAQKREVPGADVASLYAGLVSKIARDWRGVQGENGEPLPFDGAKWREAVLAVAAMLEAGEEMPGIPMPSEGGDNLRLLMNEPGLFTHVFNAYRACINGGKKIREGN